MSDVWSLGSSSICIATRAVAAFLEHVKEFEALRHFLWCHILCPLFSLDANTCASGLCQSNVRTSPSCKSIGCALSWIMDQVEHSKMSSVFKSKSTGHGKPASKTSSFFKSKSTKHGNKTFWWLKDMLSEEWRCHLCMRSIPVLYACELKGVFNFLDCLSYSFRHMNFTLLLDLRLAHCK